MKLAEAHDEVGAGRYVAWLDLGSLAPPIRCYVENLSRLGAKLKVFGGPIPEEFTLHFNRRGDAKVRCRVTTAAGLKCDVEFVASLAIYG
jgi:hypothetical protein